MELEQVLKNLYSAFSACKRPQHFTDYRHCEECQEHDEMMRSATLETLDSQHLGCVGWAPFSFLTMEGFAHYMPRIIELAITGKGNVHRDLFLNDMLFNLTPSGDYNRFNNYTNEQNIAVLNALEYAKLHFYEELENYCAEQDLDHAIAYWQSVST